jgi:hypothetical protein
VYTWCAGQLGCNASAITTINNQSALDFLSNFAIQNAQGYLEPHADWNSLMFTPTQAILGNANSFSGLASLYPGDEIIFEFEDGSNVTDNWVAMYAKNDLQNPC